MSSAPPASSPSIEELLRFERVLSEISAPLIGATTSNVRARLREGMKRILELFELERGSFLELRAATGTVVAIAGAARAGYREVLEDVPLERLMPWSTAQLLRGEVLRLSLDDLPAGSTERAYVESMAVRANLTVPIRVEGEAAFFLGMSSRRADYPFTDDVVTRLRLLGEMFTAAYARTRAEEARQRSEEHLRMILSQLPAIVWTTDRDLHITSSRGAGLAALGLEPDAAVGDDFDDLFQSDLESSIPFAAHQRALQGEPVSYDYDARDRSYLLHLEPQRDHAGGIAGVIGVAVDITERKAADQALRESEERLRQLADNIQEVFWMLDLKKHQLTYVSPAYETIWGRPRDELALDPSAWMNSIHPEDRPRVAKMLEHRGRPGGYNVTYRIRRPNGMERWVRDRGYPVLNARGEVERVAGVATDITERMKADEQLRQAQKMEAVGSLAAGVAHDFNNLLSVILSYSTMLVDDLGTDDPRRADVEEIRTAAERAAQLTRQLLTFSRKQPAHAVLVEPSTVVRDLQKMLGRVIPEHIELHVELRAQLKVLIDPGHLEQTILNLCVNARDAMPAGGRLDIRSEDVELSPEEALRLHTRAGPHVRLVVRDSGTGMDEATRTRVFEPFFTTKERGRGTGLGLSLVFGIVTQARGSITVESAVGAGSTFVLHFPALSGAAAESIDLPPATTVGGRGHETILLVEDDPQVRSVVHAVLTKRGYNVLVAPDAMTALNTCTTTEDAIDLLLTDVVMPKMSGLELAAEVSQLRPETTLVCMSGYTDETTAGYGLTPKGVTLLEKPILPDVLARKIRELLDAKA